MGGLISYLGVEDLRKIETEQIHSAPFSKLRRIYEATGV